MSVFLTQESILQAALKSSYLMFKVQCIFSDYISQILNIICKVSRRGKSPHLLLCLRPNLIQHAITSQLQAFWSPRSHQKQTLSRGSVLHMIHCFPKQVWELMSCSDILFIVTTCTSHALVTIRCKNCPNITRYHLGCYPALFLNKH